MLRVLTWRLLCLLALASSLALVAWFLHGGLGAVLRGSTPGPPLSPGRLLPFLAHAVGRASAWMPLGGLAPAKMLAASCLLLGGLLAYARTRARRRRRYVRLRVTPYRSDRASAEAIVATFDVFHKRMLRRWWRRLALGQPTISLEVHYAGAAHAAWLAVCCPRGSERLIEAALRTAYPNCRLGAGDELCEVGPVVLRLKKSTEFIKRVKALDHFEHEREPAMNRLLTAMGTCGEPAFVQIAMTPTPASFERLAAHLYRRHETHLARGRTQQRPGRQRSMVDDAELRGGLDLQHRALFFVDLRVVARSREACEAIASELRAGSAENRLVERGTGVRNGLLGIYARRVRRGEGNPMPSFHKGVLASTELAAIWQLPSSDYMTVPFARAGLPLAPAAPAIFRPVFGDGTLRDELGPVSIHVHLRKQNTAVPGTVEQGKSSYLVATVAEDLRRERCAVIVLDPKGDAADAAVGLVPEDRTCTLLDFSRPTCGFNPLAVDAPADVIADYVVAALKNLFTDADIRASSDRYLRNAIIAVLAHEGGSTLWDAARLLSVGEEGYSYRRAVGARVRTLPEFKEISQFFTAELSAQLADARSVTTAKLDAPVNKLARLLNSPSIKRVLLNDSLRVDFDRVIAGAQVLVVKGALGAMGAGNTSVLMQLLVGMLDAALARQQDLVPECERVAVALKVDEAPLVLNRGFAETMALKRSAGLETVACWQTEAQWTDREVRDQLDALFAHRVYFATASVRDARAAAELTMAQFSDVVRPGIAHLSPLGHPDVRLHLPKHYAVASWSTPEGRQPPFIAQTIPLRVDQQRLALHAARQTDRGGCHRSDLRQPHWESRLRASPEGMPVQAAGLVETTAAPSPAPASAVTPIPASAATPILACAPDLPRGAASPAGSPDPEAAATVPPASYRELVELDGAHGVRWARAAASQRSLEPEPLDLEMLALVAGLQHVLTSQLHRLFNPTRSATTTQRRLKRLSDAGLVERFQFHRRDGGGIPMCYVITAAGLEMLIAAGRVGASAVSAPPDRNGSTPAHRHDERRLRQARHDVHVAGWALALAVAVGKDACNLRGPEDAILTPPLRSTPDGRVAVGPGDLRLPGGRVPHDFLRTDATGASVEVERFDTVRPDAIVEVASAAHRRDHASATRSGAAGPAEELERSGARTGAAQTPACDVIIELDDRLPRGRAATKLERYDHFLAGWSAHVGRYGRRFEAVPVIVFVSRDRRRARDCARHADKVLRACRAYAGEYPFDWSYPGRDSILFACERDVHEADLRAYGVPALPPEVRSLAAHGDPRAAEPTLELKMLPYATPASAAPAT